MTLRKHWSLGAKLAFSYSLQKNYDQLNFKLWEPRLGRQ